MVAIDGFDVDDVLKLKSELDCDGGGADVVVVVADAPNKFTELVGFKPPNPNEAPPLEPNKFDVGAAALLGAVVDPPKLNAD